MKRFGLSLVVVLLLAASVFPFVHAQDNTMMDKHVCDSTLMTLLLVAEGDYGFHSMQDTSTFEKGQLQPLFDAMMMANDMSGDNMSSGDDMSNDSSMSDNTMAESTADASMSDNNMGNTMTDMVTLAPGNIAGEDEACTSLRAELESFFYDHWSMMSGDSMSNGG